jgi:hypothetical protein
MAKLAIPRFGAFTLTQPLDVDALRYMVASPSAVWNRDKRQDKTAYTTLVGMAAVMVDGELTTEYTPHDYSCDAAYGGRAYPPGTALPHVFMDPLCQGQHDNDIAACNPSMLLGLCERHEIPCEGLRQLCADPFAFRKAVAASEGVSYKEAKEIVNSLIAGSNFRPEDDWVIGFKREVRSATARLLELYPEYLRLKPHTERPGATAITFLLASLERWAVEIAMGLWMEEYGVCAYALDGLRTRRQVSEEAYQAASDAFHEASGIRVRWVEKPIGDGEEHGWPSFTRENAEERDVFDKCHLTYRHVKGVFEREVVKIMHPVCYVQNGADEFIVRSEDDLKKAYRNKYYYYVVMPGGSKKGKRKRGGGDAEAEFDITKGPPEVTLDSENFLKRWLDDENLRTYKRMGFVPPPLPVPEGTFNAWRGFAVEKLPPPTDAEKALYCEVVRDFLFTIICGGVEPAFEWLMKFFANMFQEPGLPKRVAPVLMSTTEGVGKNRVTVLLMMLMGYDMAFKTSELSNSVFGRFSNVAYRRLLLVLDELKPQNVGAHYNDLMDMITAEKQRGEWKGIGAPFNYDSYVRLMFTSNEEERLIKVRPNDRKYMFFDISGERANDKEYFDRLMAAIETPGVRRAFYDELMEIDYSDYDFIARRVHSQSYINAKMLTVRREVRFLGRYMLDNPRRLRCVHMTDALFAEFKTWHTAAAAMGGCEEYSMNVTSFGICMSKLPGYVRSAHHGNSRGFRFDMPAITQYMVSCDVLSETERDWLLYTADVGERDPLKPFEQFCAERTADLALMAQ